MKFYTADFPPQDGKPYQWLAVHVLRWRPHWGEPRCAFVEDDRVEDVLEPFAKMWNHIWQDMSDDHPVWQFERNVLTVGDFRKAFELLNEDEQ